MFVGYRYGPERVFVMQVHLEIDAAENWADISIDTGQVGKAMFRVVHLIS